MSSEKPPIHRELANAALHYLKAEARMHQTNSTDDLIEAVNLKMKLSDLIQRYFEEFPEPSLTHPKQ